MPKAAERLWTVDEFLAWERRDGPALPAAARRRDHDGAAADGARTVGSRLDRQLGAGLRPPCEPITEAGIKPPHRSDSYYQADLAITCRPLRRGDLRGLTTLFIALALAVIVGIVFIQEGQRRIPVQYAKRVRGDRMTSGGSTYLPLRVNMAGVIPVIFAASLMAFPPTIGELTQAQWAQDISAFFNPNGTAFILGNASSSSSSPTSTRPSPSIPWARPTTSKKYGGFIRG